MEMKVRWESTLEKMPFNDVVPLGNCVMLFSFFKWIYCMCIWFKTFCFVFLTTPWHAGS